MALEIDRITKRFGAREAVSDVSLTADDGEFVVLLGPRAAANRRCCA